MCVVNFSKEVMSFEIIPQEVFGLNVLPFLTDKEICGTLLVCKKMQEAVAYMFKVEATPESFKAALINATDELVICLSEIKCAR